MAKKKKFKQVLAHKKQQQKAHRPAMRLEEAQQALRSNDLQKAVQLAEALRRTVSDPTTTQQIHQILSESHFRLAASSNHPAERLQHLDHALAIAPNEARIHYHRGLTLWRMGKIEDALPALALAEAKEPGRTGMYFLRQLGQLAQGHEGQETNLSAAEVNTLRFLQQLKTSGDAKKALATLTGKPLLGTDGQIWDVLAQMQVNPKAVPIGEWQKSTQNGARTNPVIAYYDGVMAMRKGELAEAVAGWQRSAQVLVSPWLSENLLNSRRDLAVGLAQEQRWQEVVPIYEQTKADSGADKIDSVLAEVAGAAYAQLGTIAAQANQWVQARSHFHTAVQLNPSRALFQNLALAEESAENWGEAAEAWREMIRRRPRKEDHPDYLTDDQAAAIWQHAATCYQQVEEMEKEVITCLQNAIKYAPNDLSLRLNLVDTMKGEGRDEAVENELDRILEIEPKHVQALIRLAALYSGRWDRDPKPIWERVLAEEPNNSDAQLALAHIYAAMAMGETRVYQARDNFVTRTLPQKIKILEEGLQKLPDHQILLFAFGQIYAEAKKIDKARSYYEQAARRGLVVKDLAILNLALHELLHVNGGEAVKELTAQMSKFTGLLATFWIGQADRVMECELGDTWAEFFWDEAVRMVETAATRSQENSLAGTLLLVFKDAYEYDIESAIVKYEKRLRNEFANSGAAEYIDACYLVDKAPDKTAPVLALLRKSQSTAERAKEPKIAEMAEEFHEEVKYPPLANPFGGDMQRIMRKMMEEFDPEELDAIRRLF